MVPATRAQIIQTVIAAIGLDLGSRPQMQDVLDGQGMRRVLGGQTVDHAHIPDAVDVDPARGGLFGPVASKEPAGTVILRGTTGTNR